MQQNAQPTVVGGATSFGALEEHNRCFDPLKGYRSKITGDMLEAKLGKATGLSAPQRAAWQQDLAAVRAAQAAGSDDVASPDPKDAHLYLSYLTTEEQTQLNGQYGAYYNQVVSGCQGRDVMNVGRTTPMSYVNNSAAGDAQATAATASAAASMACLSQLSTVRWAVMAEKMQAKMATLTLSAPERAAWEADIAVVKQAQAGTTQMPMSPDPQNPMRYMMRLSPEEQMAMNNDVIARTTALTQQCVSASSTPVARPIESGGLVDRSRSPANPNQQPAPARQRTQPPRNGGALGAGRVDSLTASNACYEPLRGHLALVTADALEAKLAKATGLSAQQRTEWQQDIASWRAAQAAGADRATPPDPNNPYRWEDRFTRDERAQINGQHAAFNNKIVRECGARDSGIGTGGEGFN